MSDLLPTEPVPRDPEHYFNRELSWLDFNSRVLSLAADSSLPLLERLKFVAIWGQNLDEFFQVALALRPVQLPARVFD